MLGGRTKLIGLAAATLAIGVMAAPAQGQFGGLLRGSRNKSESKPEGCSEAKRSTGSRIAGGILGGIAGGVAGRAGGLIAYVPVATLTDQLTASIACRLDPDEQKQAADATLEATRGADETAAPEIGAMAAWTSNTREDVSGTSTVVARDDSADGSLQCITVTDVVIVKGEEARADKRMCRRPPAARYAIVA
ncbi:MAG TPA: hypothetical protein VEB68_05110 [Croceibacterium sp.]|nr:hypothetical protein [Croceibacterium sp.]